MVLEEQISLSCIRKIIQNKNKSKKSYCIKYKIYYFDDLCFHLLHTNFTSLNLKNLVYSYFKNYLICYGCLHCHSKHFYLLDSTESSSKKMLLKMYLFNRFFENHFLPKILNFKHPVYVFREFEIIAINFHFFKYIFESN